MPDNPGQPPNRDWVYALVGLAMVGSAILIGVTLLIRGGVLCDYLVC